MRAASTVVLCLDCEPPVLDGAREVLEAGGHRTVPIPAVPDAAELLGATPDLLVIGLGADASRWEAALHDGRRLRASGVFVPVLCLVPEGQTERGVRALKAGADEFVELPAAPEALLARVEALLRIKRIQDRMDRSRRDLGRMAHVDPATGLLTRAQLLERAEAALEASRRSHDPVSLVLVDVVPVGGTEPPPADKHRLRAVATLLSGQVRDADQVGRAGPTAFGVVMPQTHLAGAVQAAERLRAALAGLEAGGTGGRGWEAALGLAFFPAHGVRTHQDLLRVAEDALGRALAEPQRRICLYQVAPYAWQRPGSDRGDG